VEKSKVLEVVTRHFNENVGTHEGPLDASKSMLDMGATSLDIVEIVSGVTRELSVKVPRTTLAQAKTVNDLVDLLVKAVGEIR
jgi:acyl carrier protein